MVMCFSYQLISFVFQVMEQREDAIRKIEQLAAYFRNSGQCDAWFERADAKVRSSFVEPGATGLQGEGTYQYHRPPPTTTFHLSPTTCHQPFHLPPHQLTTTSHHPATCHLTSSPPPVHRPPSVCVGFLCELRCYEKTGDGPGGVT